jgi:hypothetical protein
MSVRARCRAQRCDLLGCAVVHEGRPIWRSPIHDAAIGAPAEISASVTTKRSNGVRPCPPTSRGNVIPSHPRSPSSREKGFE